MIFRPKSEIQRFFPPKVRCSPKKKKKKKDFTEIESDFSAEIRNSKVFSAENQVFSKKKKKRTSLKLRVIFRPKSEIQRFFPPKIRCSPKKKDFTEIESDFSADIRNSKVFSARIQVVSKKKKKGSSPKLRLIFRPISQTQTFEDNYTPITQTQTSEHGALSTVPYDKSALVNELRS